ncbi:MAG: SRPBCC family protein [Bacteroidota bacterium]
MKKLESLAKAGKINEEASVKDKQSIIIQKPIEEVWERLTTINEWSSWNSQVSDVSAENIPENRQFNWILNGNGLQSKIALLSKPVAFSFISRSSLLKMVILFKLEEIGTKETAVEMEGSMEGLKTIFAYKHRKIHKSFLKWLEDLRKS